MLTKLFEVRDKGAFLPVLATKIEPKNEAQAYLLRRAGFFNPSVPYILLCRINIGGGESRTEPYQWSGRTMLTSHKYLAEHWETLVDGDVIDVEFTLGETKVKKVSQRVSDQPK